MCSEFRHHYFPLSFSHPPLFEHTHSRCSAHKNIYFNSLLNKQNALENIKKNEEEEDENFNAFIIDTRPLSCHYKAFNASNVVSCGLSRGQMYDYNTLLPLSPALPLSLSPNI